MQWSLRRRRNFPSDVLLRVSYSVLIAAIAVEVCRKLSDEIERDRDTEREKRRQRVQ